MYNRFHSNNLDSNPSSSLGWQRSCLSRMRVDGRLARNLTTQNR